MNNKKTALVSSLSGIITALSFIFENIYFIAFVGIVPAIYCIIINKKVIFTATFHFFYSFYLFSDIWFFYVGQSFCSSKAAGFFLSLAMVTVISLILALTASVPFLMLKNIHVANSLLFSVIFSFIYIFGEWIHGLSPLNFSWNRLCNIVACNNSLIQLSSVFGGLFISFLIIIINTAIAFFIKYISERQLRFMFPLTTAVLIFTANIFLGNKLSEYYSTPQTKDFEVLMVQPNFSVTDKRNMSAEKMLGEQIRLSQNGITKNTELIVFPETSVSERFFHDNIYSGPLYKFVEKYEICILFGTSYKNSSDKYNSCLMLSPDKKISDIYFKRKLVPFGEYTPSFLPRNFHFFKSTYCKGKENTIINDTEKKIGCCICYESIFPSLCRENTILGAEFLAILSNDAWLGRFAPLYQHHSHSVLRAVENRKYTITCANTGISSVISSNGEIIAASQKNQKQTVSATIHTNDIITFYTRHGDIIVIPSVIIILFLIALNIIYFLKKLAK